MFYKKGIDITKDKQMFNFLHDHFRYSTMNSWNGLKSIANNVKVYNLNLDGDDNVALALLEDEEYDSINYMIYNWEGNHKGYRVGFNGRSEGYLVLYNDNNNRNVLPEHIADCDYENYKQYCKYYNGSVRENRYELVEYTKLVQDFDKLCDELRDYVNDLSQLDCCKCSTESAVEEFNANYDSDLNYCGFHFLKVDKVGKVDISEIKKMSSLLEAFIKILNNNSYGYKVKIVNDCLWLEEA